MPTYLVAARDSAGRAVSRTLEARNEGEATALIREEGLVLVRIRRRSGAGGADRGLKQEDKVLFTRQLSTIYRSGIPILQGLTVLEKQAESPVLRSVLVRIRRDVAEGEPLSAALGKHPTCFDELYVNTVRAGERGGVLEAVLDRLSVILEHENETRQAVKSALRYPIVVIVALACAVTVLLLFVVPRFTDLFARFGHELPLPTRVLIAVHGAIVSYGELILLVLVAAILGFFIWRGTPRGRLAWDGFVLRIPIAGALVRKSCMSRFAQMFGLLTRAGVPVLQNLEIVGRTIGNARIALDVDEARRNVERGGTIADGLATSTVFPPLIVHMISVGERTGDVEGLMEAVTRHYDTEVGYGLKNLTGMIEPIITVVLGMLILFLALAIFLPIWNMTKLFR